MQQRRADLLLVDGGPLPLHRLVQGRVPRRGPEPSRSPRRRDAALARQGLDWVSFTSEATGAIREVVPFDRCCWHTVDPGTVLLTGSVNRDVGCSGSWLAEHDYVIEDVNKWWFLARRGRHGGATSLATHGDLSRSPRHRSHARYGIGDELRGSFVWWGEIEDVGRRPFLVMTRTAAISVVHKVLAAPVNRTILASFPRATS